MTVYFLRRLAFARRKRGCTDPSIPHSEALVELGMVVFVAPTLAVLLLLTLATLKLWAHRIQLSEIPFKASVVAGVILLLVFARHLLARRYKAYLDDPTPSLQFDTERDRRIVFWQKLVIVPLGCIVASWLGILVTYLWAD